MDSRKQEINIAQIDKEIAELDEKLKDIQAIVQRRSDLMNIKLLAQRLWGSADEAGATPSNGNGAPNTTTAGIAFGVLATKGPMQLQALLKAMREAGWIGSGNDTTDRRRIYSAIYKKPEFEQVRDGVWGVTTK